MTQPAFFTDQFGLDPNDEILLVESADLDRLVILLSTEPDVTIGFTEASLADGSGGTLSAAVRPDTYPFQFVLPSDEELWVRRQQTGGSGVIRFMVTKIGGDS